MALPNLVIIGPLKSGTTSLFFYLAEHPEICASRIKETNYFQSLQLNKPLANLKIYEKYFKHYKKEKYIMEASQYINGGTNVAKSIKETLGRTRIISILRDPIERAFAIYKHKKRFLKIKQEVSFHQYILGNKKNEYKFYDELLAPWFEYFGDSLKILFFEHLRDNPLIFMHKLCEWLSIDKHIYDKMDFKNFNKGDLPRHRMLHRIAIFIYSKVENKLPYKIDNKIRKVYYSVNTERSKEGISRETREYLQDIFQPHNKNLRKMLEKHRYSEFPNWLIQNNKKY